MTKHSRNNTASSVFTYAEYKKLDQHYGTKKQRLGAESMRQFDACSLCLQRARDPMACSQGHIYCRECVLSDLLSQKKEIKRYQAKLEAMAREEEEQKAQAKLRARERVLDDFEKKHLGLAAGESSKRIGAGVEPVAGSISSAEARGTKRKFDFDNEAVDKLAQEAEAAALRQIEVEQAEARRDKLPDFWLPSLMPTAVPGPLKDVKLGCLCHQSTPSHSMSLKTLIPVIFTFDTNATNAPSSTSSSNPSTTTSTATSAPSSTSTVVDTRRAICPSCKKELSNSTNLTLLRKCSHLVCRTCCDTLVKPSNQCAVCDTPAKDKDLIHIDREGTGYSAGGRAETAKVGVAFQG